MSNVNDESTDSSSSVTDKTINPHSNASNEDLFNDIKNFHHFTFLGVGLAFIFLVLCFIVTLSVRWYLMIPIAIGSFYLLFSRKDNSAGLEKKVCTYGLWVITGLFIIRDIDMSNKVGGIIDAARSFQNLF